MKSYDENSIKVLKGLDAVRTRPDMYLGSTTGQSSPALYRMFREILDNSLDEYLIGINFETHLFIDEYITIIDNGRGVPTGLNKETKQNTLEIVFGELHSSGKFNAENYAISSGKNGVGSSCTNAMSEHFIAYSNNNKKNKWYKTEFDKGKLVKTIEEDPIEEYKKYVKKNGTIVRYIPDKSLFKDGTVFDISRLKRELRDLKYLCPKLHIFLHTLEEDTEYFSNDGLASLVKSDTGNNIFQYTDKNMEVAINFAKIDGYNFKSYVNLCNTDMGGTHLIGLKSVITDTLKSYSKLKLNNNDLLEGIVGAIHYKMSEPQYQSQTKNELCSAIAKTVVMATLAKPLTKFFDQHSSIRDRIISYAEKMYADREKMKEQKDLYKNLKDLNSAVYKISDKFLDADRRKYAVSDLEMFIVEGDSAGGHFKNARNSNQAELKIRGKIINAERSTYNSLFGSPKEKNSGNKEIKDLLTALGCGMLDHYDESKLRFDKVILLCFDGKTKVKLLNGTSKTFEELVEYEKTNPDTVYYVYSKDENGNIVPGKAMHPRITGYRKELIKLTFDTGNTIECTPEHKFMLVDGTYKEAKDLETTDSLMPLYTKLNENKVYNSGRELVYENGKWEFTHHLVSEFYNGETKYGEQIHHIDKNYLNNNPSNLTILTTEEHRKIHAADAGKLGKEYLTRYNKSAAHRDRISYLWKNSNVYKDSTWKKYNQSKKHIERIKELHKNGYYNYDDFKKYNDSLKAKQFHSDLITKLNRSEDIIKERNKTRLINLGIMINVNGFNIIEDTFTKYHLAVTNKIGTCPTIEYILKYFGSFENYKDIVEQTISDLAYEAIEKFKNNNLTAELIHNRQIGNINTKKNSMARIGKLLFDKKLVFNEYNYTKVRNEIKAIRTPKFENFKNYFENFEQFEEYSKNYNHKIISKEFITLEEPIPVYDLTVEKYHNFAIDIDGNRNGTIVKNCDADPDGAHITNLLIAFFIDYMPELIKNGHLYLIDAPLFIANSEKVKVSGKTRAEVDSKMKDLKIKEYVVSRLKGWGECSAEQLSEICLDKKTRKLIKLKWNEDCNKTLADTMGKDTSYRKELLNV